MQKETVEWCWHRSRKTNITRYFMFYILLTMHHVMILVKWPMWCTILFYAFIFIFNSLHVLSTSCSSLGETNCVNTTSGSCHSVSVAVSCAGWKWTSDLYTTRPPTQSDSYQRLYWHNLFLLMMSAMCSKHVESENKNKYIERICASRWSFTKNGFMFVIWSSQ
jgi:hypothetical protein